MGYRSHFLKGLTCGYPHRDRAPLSSTTNKRVYQPLATKARARWLSQTYRLAGFANILCRDAVVYEVDVRVPMPTIGLGYYVALHGFAISETLANKSLIREGVKIRSETSHRGRGLTMLSAHTLYLG